MQAIIMIGVISHPRSAARQREVPELSVPMAAQVSLSAQVLEAAPASPAFRREAVEFKVRYRFVEYLGFTMPMAIRMR